MVRNGNSVVRNAEGTEDRREDGGIEWERSEGRKRGERERKGGGGGAVDSVRSGYLTFTGLLVMCSWNNLYCSTVPPARMALCSSLDISGLLPWYSPAGRQVGRQARQETKQESVGMAQTGNEKEEGNALGSESN